MNSSVFGKSLFKYKSFRNESEDHVKRLLVDYQIYFAKPSQLNDPFDCGADISIGNNAAERLDFLRNMLYKKIKLNHNISEDTFESNLKKLQWDTDEKVEQKVYGIIKDAIERIGIFCLTPKPDNLLMWSHYASNHSGLCIEFDFSEGSILRSKCEKVIYSANFPIVNLSIEPEDYWAKKILLTKSIEWLYEDEWRAIDLRGSGEEKIPDDMIKGIIFGFRMSDDNIKEIISWFSNRRQSFNFYRSVLAKKEYRIEILPLS